MPNEICPQCQNVLPVTSGYRTWCEKCEWNLGERPTIARPSNLFLRIHQTLNQRSSEALFQAMRANQPRSFLARIALLLAYVVASGVHGVGLALVGVGLYCIIFVAPAYRGLGWLVGAALILFALWLFKPRLRPAPGTLLPPQDFPALYSLTNQIAAQLTCAPVAELRYNFHFNAMIGDYGWRRTSVVTLGIPLLVILEPQELIAILSHELAHKASGDPSRGLFLWTAMDSLAEVYDLVAFRAPTWLAFVNVYNLLRWLVSHCIWALAYLLTTLLWHDSQRAEYRADLLGAQVSGTPAQLQTLNKLHLYILVMEYLKTAQANPNFRHGLRDKLQALSADMPEREYERLQRLDRWMPSFFYTTHPPSHLRAEVLRSNPYPAALTANSATLDFARVIAEVDTLWGMFERQVIN